MKPPEGIIVRLAPEDEYTHPIEEAKNFNESMYFNLFDATPLGGWFRIGNRPNEGYAEMSCCLYLPDGSIGFMYGRPEISNNDAFDAAGMKFSTIEPFKKLKVTYDGQVCLLKNPYDMADPKKAFTQNPLVPCRVDLDYDGLSPMYGGEAVKADGSPIEEKPEESFARAHYEQHISGRGLIRVGDREWTIDGHGLRDHSWGPRYWQNIYWYRWLPMNFGPGFGMMISIVTMADGKQRIGGMVLRDNEYVLIDDVRIEADYDEHYYQTTLKAWARTAEREYQVEGRVVSLIPLRNRRKAPDGTVLHTRITEGMTEYRCDGRVGYGMSEFLDQVVDGRPVGL
ncbi:MAG: hypothetical protein KKB20_17680 [Proteobacteria bacterium]|nr:hypothetical protein [Pseudomonadota bacterium]